MSKKPSPFNQIIHLLHALHKAYPHHNLGRHLSLALSDYGDLWGVADRELLFALEKYQTQLDLDPLTSEEDVQKIIEDTNALFSGDYTALEEEEEDY